MIHEEGYRAKEQRANSLKKIKQMEADMINNKLPAINGSGGYTYEFLDMMNETRAFLAITKPFDEDENPLPEETDNDLTVGDIQ